MEGKMDVLHCELLVRGDALELGIYHYERHTMLYLALLRWLHIPLYCAGVFVPGSAWLRGFSLVFRRAGWCCLSLA